MKTFLSLLLLTFISIMPAHAGFEGMSAGKSLKLFNRINCGSGLTCTKGKNGIFNMVSTATGTLNNQVTASATTITADQCGSTFVNAAAVAIILPKSSAALIGCRLSFVTANASNFDVDPNIADQILVLTDAAGDKIRNATVGNSVSLQAISATQWAVVGINGTWTDAN